jgi:hypothetical protein
MAAPATHPGLISRLARSWLGACNLHPRPCRPTAPDAPSARHCSVPPALLKVSRHGLTDPRPAHPARPARPARPPVWPSRQSPPAPLYQCSPPRAPILSCTVPLSHPCCCCPSLRALAQSTLCRFRRHSLLILPQQPRSATELRSSSCFCLASPFSYPYTPQTFPQCLPP